jgi:hypothetical protein
VRERERAVNELIKEFTNTFVELKRKKSLFQIHLDLLNFNKRHLPINEMAE